MQIKLVAKGLLIPSLCLCLAFFCSKDTYMNSIVQNELLDELANELDKKTTSSIRKLHSLTIRIVALTHFSKDIRKQMRNGKKCITTVEGLSAELDVGKIAKCWTKLFSCMGGINTKDDDEKVLWLSGDHRDAVSQWLQKEGIATKSEIKIHGA